MNIVENGYFEVDTGKLPLEVAPAEYDVADHRLGLQDLSIRIAKASRRNSKAPLPHATFQFVGLFGMAIQKPPQCFELCIDVPLQVRFAPHDLENLHVHQGAFTVPEVRIQQAIIVVTIRSKEEAFPSKLRMDCFVGKNWGCGSLTSGVSG